METEFTSLNQLEKENFLVFIKKLVQKYKPEQIYCFGKNIDFRRNESCFIESQREEKHHYFLLMVTESITRIEHEVQFFADNCYPSGKVTILAHGKETIEDAISANNRFFITVYNNAQILYSSDGIVQRTSSINFIPTQSAVKAQKHYNHRLPLAIGFLKSAKECLINQHYNLCVFMGHQVVEQCCIALIRVHLAYRSEMHNLYRPLGLCDSFSLAPSGLLLSGGDDRKRLFEIMVKSYSAARYKADFKVEKDDAEQIFINVSAFLKLTEVMCADKIRSLEVVAQSYKESKKESEISYAG
jgi:HEPN domain-containing protein